MKTYNGILSNGKSFTVKATSMREAIEAVSTSRISVVCANGKA